MNHKKSFNGGFIGLVVLMVVVAIIALIMVRSDLFTPRQIDSNTAVEKDKGFLELSTGAIDKAKDAKRAIEFNNQRALEE